MIVLSLSDDEYVWLIQCLAKSRELGRLWDLRAEDDPGNAILAKLGRARIDQLREASGDP